MRDKLICKVIENREEFQSHLRYLSWDGLNFAPLLDLLAVLPDVGSTVSFGKLMSLRTVFPSSHTTRGWNSEETLTRDNFWHVPNYPRTPSFDCPDPTEQVIAAQMISMVICVCKFAINHPPRGSSLSLDQLLRYTMESLGTKMSDLEGAPILLPVPLPRNMPCLDVGDDEDLLAVVGDEHLELALDEAEMSKLLEDQPVQQSVNLEGQPVEKLAGARSSPPKTVQFSKRVSCWVFVFGDDRLGDETISEIQQWPKMERARDIPRLEPSKLMDKARWRERAAYLIKKQGYRTGLPLVDEHLRPSVCRNRSILKVKTHQETRSGPEQKVAINQNDNMTWNFLAKLQHPVPKINARSASPVPPYLKRRAVIACLETLAALLVRQYDHDGTFQGRPMQNMAPNPMVPPSDKKVFPASMTGDEIRKAHHPIRKASAQRPVSLAPPPRPVTKSSEVNSVVTAPTARVPEDVPVCEGKKRFAHQPRNGGACRWSPPRLSRDPPGSPSAAVSPEVSKASPISPEPSKKAPLSSLNLSAESVEAVSPGKRKASPLGTSRQAKSRRLSTSSSSSSSSSSESDLDLSRPENFGKMVMREVSRRCISYVQSLEERLRETVTALKTKKETKHASTQTEKLGPNQEDGAQVSVFDRLN